MEHKATIMLIYGKHEGSIWMKSQPLFSDQYCLKMRKLRKCKVDAGISDIAII